MNHSLEEEPMAPRVDVQAAVLDAAGPEEFEGWQ